MPVNNRFTSALKGNIMGNLLNIKNISVIAGMILLFQLLINHTIVFITSGIGGSNDNSGGILSTGFGVALISMMVIGIVASTGKELKIAFTFPINREVYALGVFVKFLAASFILLVITTVVAALELVGSKIASLLLPRFVVVNKIGITAFLLGFWVSLCYIILVAAVFYCIFMYITRFKLIVLALICGTLLLMLVTVLGRRILGAGFTFYLFERSPLLLSIKLWGTAIIFHVLAYLPLKTLEVKA